MSEAIEEAIASARFLAMIDEGTTFYVYECDEEEFLSSHYPGYMVVTKKFETHKLVWSSDDQ